MCSRYNTERCDLKTALKQIITPETLTEEMVSSEAACITTFVTKILKDLLHEEQEKTKQKDRGHQNCFLNPPTSRARTGQDS